MRSLPVGGLLLAGLTLACAVEEPTSPTRSGEPTSSEPTSGQTAAAVVTTTTIIDQAGIVGVGTSLAIGADGRHHITYKDQTNGRLKYATCVSSCGSAGNWTMGAIDDKVGTKSSLKVADIGRRHLTYSSNSGLMYATCAPSATCTSAGAWAKAAIDVTGSGSSLAFAKGGNKEVAYVRSVLTGSTPLHQIKFAACPSACAESGSWSRAVVDQFSANGGHEGEYTSLAIGPDGRRHITYTGFGQWELRYATCLSSCGTAANWQKLTIDHTADGVAYSSLAVGQDGVLHVAYYDFTNLDLKYARCAFDCTTAANWKKVAVATAGNVGHFPSLAVETNGRVHISSYHESGTALYYATCNADCTVPSNWMRSVLDGVNSEVGNYSSLAVRNGSLYVSYYDGTNSALKWLRRSSLVVLP